MMAQVTDRPSLAASLVIKIAASPSSSVLRVSNQSQLFALVSSNSVEFSCIGSVFVASKSNKITVRRSL